MKLQNTIRLALLATVFLGVGVVAGATPPVLNPPNATFTGDQSGGISSGVHFSSPPIYTVNVLNLTTDIAPAAGVSGIKILTQGANGSNGSGSVVGDGGNGGAGSFGGTSYLTIESIDTFPYFRFVVVTLGPKVNFAGGDQAIVTSGANAHGIIASSVGGKGGDGGWAVGALGLGPAWGGHGGAGGDGAPASVTSSGDIETQGSSSYGILAESWGGNGGNGGWAGAASYAEGGDGGKGGTGGPVTVVSSSHIITRGNSSDAIVGQSLGGAGGSGGDGGAVAGQGGGVLGSGPGGSVNITNHGTIETFGTESRGIYAQSIGGFAAGAGGGGGIVGWGGSGNSAGDGGAVTVTNHGAITTTGKDADSIYAQSIGGGGGRASASGGLVGIGGTGSAGGHGGTVSVTNHGVLRTGGDEARGILAQSIGGGGGSGGSSGGAFSIGGDGKATGNGAAVTVNNTGAITTGGITDEGIVTGNGSDAIFAQSLGGGGGVTGGSGANDYGFFMSLGGKGDSGGNGSTVTVTNSGALATTGVDASGILAQSIGGGGGNGGQAYDIGLGFTYAAGGNSALGGNGGKVTVTSQDTSITTAGALSHGIHALSMGGGGGTGGNVLSITGGIQFAATYNAGGRGGGGGYGDDVTVNSASRIETHGELAHGLFAESVGGGGGVGGNVVSWVANVGVIPEMPAISASLTLGGVGGKGGNGGIVTAGNTGEIDTFGAFGYGVFAQSVGGGGGAGGNVVAGSIAVNTIDVTLAVGGAGGGAGDGKLVDVDNSGSIETRGDFGYGILAQSVGGGGGAGGNTTTLSINVNVVTNLQDLIPTPGGSLNVSLGGKSGGGGHGGIVDVTNLGTISTKGELAHGILAQSVGGGGGAGGNCLSVNIDPSMNPLDYIEYFDVMSFDSEFLLGGRGGSGGNGSAVTVRNSGTISTEGNFAAGILAQSIGGGGGAGGSTRSTTYSLLASDDSPMRFKRGGSSGGNGGDVTVVNSGDITTHGGFAHGILAQSIGGGGGFGGISETDNVSLMDLAGTRGASSGNRSFGAGFAGSTGGWGSAGAVNVTHHGNITTYGDISHGIFAQSASGWGSAGPVTVTLGSEVIAHGVDSDGIFAQSVGSSNGNISININGGTVRGGSGSGAGVHIDGGAINTLANSGTISALSGTAILAGRGNDTVHNFGTVTGSVNLGIGVNRFENNPGARFNTGAFVDLGTDNSLINGGVLSPGGKGTVLHTRLDGDLVLAEGGVLEIDIGGFTPGSFDSIEVTGGLTGGSGPDGLLPAGGTIQFSFLPEFDIVPEIGPRASMVLEFLSVGSMGGFADGMSYRFSGRPFGLRYDVFVDDGSFYLRASNVVPAPGAMLLAGIGLVVIRLTRRRFI